MSPLGGKADRLCSRQAFPLLTQLGRRQRSTKKLEFAARPIALALSWFRSAVGVRRVVARRPAVNVSREHRWRAVYLPTNPVV